MDEAGDVIVERLSTSGVEVSDERSAQLRLSERTRRRRRGGFKGAFLAEEVEPGDDGTTLRSPLTGRPSLSSPLSLTFVPALRRCACVRNSRSSRTADDNGVNIPFGLRVLDNDIDRMTRFDDETRLHRGEVRFSAPSGLGRVSVGAETVLLSSVLCVGWRSLVSDANLRDNFFLFPVAFSDVNILFSI